MQQVKHSNGEKQTVLESTDLSFFQSLKLTLNFQFRIWRMHIQILPGYNSKYTRKRFFVITKSLYVF